MKASKSRIASYIRHRVRLALHRRADDEWGYFTPEEKKTWEEKRKTDKRKSKKPPRGQAVALIKKLKTLQNKAPDVDWPEIYTTPKQKLQKAMDYLTRMLESTRNQGERGEQKLKELVERYNYEFFGWKLHERDGLGRSDPEMTFLQDKD